MPGFNTMKIDIKDLYGKSIEETLVDITESYGKTQIAASDSLTRYTIKFDNYGLNMKPEKLVEAYEKTYCHEEEDCRDRNMRFDDTLEYMAEKIGYDPDNST